MAGRYLVGQHAAERLEERNILEWQIVDGVAASDRILERPVAVPNPTVELRQRLADGSEVKAVWAYIITLDVAKPRHRPLLQRVTQWRFPANECEEPDW